MKRLVLTSAVFLAVLAGVGTDAAYATEIPTIASMDSTTKATVKTRLLTWPAAGPTDDLLTGMWRARTAATVQPAVVSSFPVGGIIIAGTAGYIAYRITDATLGAYIYQKWVNNDPTPTGTVTSAKWVTGVGTTACTTTYGSGVPCLQLQTELTIGSGYSAAYCSVTPVNGTTCPSADSRNADRISYHTGAPGSAYGPNYVCTGCSYKIRNEAEQRQAMTVQPMTSGEWAAAPSDNQVTSGTSTKTTLSDAEAQAGLDAINAGDEGAQDGPDAEAVDHISDGLGFGMIVMPDLLGLSTAAAESALATAGYTGTITYVDLDTEGAVVEYPAEAVVTQSVAASTEVAEDVALTLERNPAAGEMPFTILQPLPNETYTAYIARLTAAGHLGTATEVLETTAVAGYGPEAVTRVIVETTPGTTRVLDPLDWPGTAIATQADIDITIRYNPDTATPVPTEGGGGGGGGGGGLDFSPVTNIDWGCRFPYGIFCYAIAFTEMFDVAEDAPVFSFTLGFMGSTGVPGVGEAPYVVDLNVMDSYMELWRSILSVCLWVGAVYFVATRFLGFHAGGDPGEAIDDVM